MKKGEFQIDSMYLPDIYNKDEVYIALEGEIRELNIPVVYLSRGMEVRDGMLNIKILQPQRDTYYSDKNEASMVFQVKYREFSMLFTGDVEGQGEKELLETGVLEDIDVLKVAHHGSEYSMCEGSLYRLRPEISLISCGKNNSYGHPHQALLQRLQKVKSKVYVTKDVGAVTLETDGLSLVLSNAG